MAVIFFLKISQEILANQDRHTFAKNMYAGHGNGSNKDNKSPQGDQN